MKSTIPLLLLSTIIISCNTTTPEVTYAPMDYNLYFGGNKAGYFQSRMSDDGVYHYEMEYNDRGRGPHLEEAIRLNPEGYSESVEILGHNYLKDTVSETFGLSNGEAQWKSTSEKGRAASQGPAFYVGVNSSFGNTELLIRKMLATPGQAIDIYPSGTLNISAVQEVPLGDTLNLKLIEVVGYGFSPTYVWFDMEDRFFAAPSSWLTAIKKGYESLSEELLEIQLAREKGILRQNSKGTHQNPGGEVGHFKCHNF